MQWRIEFDGHPNGYSVHDPNLGRISSLLTRDQAFALFKQCWERDSMKMPRLPMEFVVVLKSGYRFTISQDEADLLSGSINAVGDSAGFRTINNRIIIRVSEIAAMHPADELSARNPQAAND